MGAISSSGASVGSCARPRPQQYNMVARTTILVVFTIVLAATGVFVPEADRDLEESDGSRESLNSLEGFVDVSESGEMKLLWLLYYNDKYFRTFT